MQRAHHVGGAQVVGLAFAVAPDPADPARFTAFVSHLARHLAVDNSLTDAEIRRTALSLRLQSDDIELLQAPLSGFGTSPDGQSIDVVDTKKLAELSEALEQDTMDAYVQKYPKG